MRIYDFNDVVGNGNIVAMIRQSLLNGTFPQISIFSGQYGTGKSTCAEIVALALTCEKEPVDNPCLCCNNCRSTIKTLQTTAENSRVVKINVGKKNSKADTAAMIEDIFVLKSSESKVVYIIEEAHALEDRQVALLEELDKIPKGVYVIFCTTKLTKILPELRSRAINFAFTRITDADANTLLDNLGRKRSFFLDEESKKIIRSAARGIPRQLTRLYEFIADGDYKTETIADFLGIVNESDFVSLFEVMKNNDMLIFSKMLDQYVKSYSLDSFIEQLKEFVIKVTFLIEGGITEGLYMSDVDRLQKVFSNVDSVKVSMLVSGIPFNATEADFKFAMIKLRQYMCNKNLNDIIKNKAVDAVTQNSKAKALSAEVTAVERETKNHNSLSPINTAFLEQF